MEEQVVGKMIIVALVVVVGNVVNVLRARWRSWRSRW